MIYTSNHQGSIFCDEDDEIGVIYDDDEREKVIRMLNVHDELVDACEKALKEYKELYDGVSGPLRHLNPTEKLLVEALKQAKGE
jgi:hypothetical protein